MMAPVFELGRILHQRNASDYCGFRRLGIAVDHQRNQLHHALVHDAGMSCVDVETGQSISSVSMPGTSGVKDCSYSSPENICCCASGRSFMCFDPRQQRAAVQSYAIESALSAISCSNDGRYIAYASSDSTVGLFSLRMNCVVRPGLFHTSCVNSCHFQDDNSGFWTAGSDRLVSKFKAETGSSQINFKDHADPVLVCKPAIDGSMMASGAADHVVSLRQLSSGRQKSLQDKVLLLGHSTPITEVIFTNDVRCKRGLCSFSQDGDIVLWDVCRASVEGKNLRDLNKRNQMPADERLDFDQSFRDLQNHCETLAVAKASMDSLCGWGASPVLQKLVPYSSQRCPGDQGVWKSRKIVGDTGIGKAIALSGGRDSGSLMICSSKRGVILIRVNTENLYS